MTYTELNERISDCEALIARRDEFVLTEITPIPTKYGTFYQIDGHTFTFGALSEDEQMFVEIDKEIAGIEESLKVLRVMRDALGRRG